MTLNNFKLEAAIEELRDQYKQLGLNAGIIDDKLKGLLSNSSILVTLFAGLNSAKLLAAIATSKICIPLAISAAFLFLLVVCFVGLWPQNYKQPFQAANLKKLFLEKRTKGDVLEQIVNNYVARIAEFEALNRQKAQWLELAYFGFVLVIVLILMFTFIAI
ncbi:MAG: hypothetical protein KF701_07220 [Anaerolineales bacterium]|nr:MAG: hypothetical protein KF701_07220 [Anaerolineales bacterium]